MTPSVGPHNKQAVPGSDHCENANATNHLPLIKNFTRPLLIFNRSLKRTFRSGLTPLRPAATPNLAPPDGEGKSDRLLIKTRAQRFPQ